MPVSKSGGRSQRTRIVGAVPSLYHIGVLWCGTPAESMTNFQDKATFIWGVADLIRDNFNRGKYKDVILPFTMLRCVDTVLEPTRQQVVERYHRFKNNYRCCN
jgi:hypothetical protein